MSEKSDRSNPSPTPPEATSARSRRIRLSRRGLVFGLIAIVSATAAFLIWRSPSLILDTAPKVRFFQIATGSTAGTYFPVGQMIATMISQPAGSGTCRETDRC
ncbi:MAG: hypothetical protein ACC634_09415, partial [Hyphomicrobiales bacterium]